MPTPIQLDFLLPVAAFLLAAFSYTSRRVRSRGLPYPPGPQRIPIIGNLLDMPSHEEWVTYKEWSDQYGSDVVHVDVLGTHMVIINSAKAANELFDKRSSIYSDRPSLVALNTILGMDWVTGFIPYGARWRSLRRGLHAHFHPAAAKAYRPLEQHAVHRLLRNLLQEPESFSQHLRHMAGQVILAIAYGIDVRPQGDPYVALAEKALHAVSLATSMGGELFDLVPWLIYMPHWFPGASLKREGRNWRHHVTAMIDEPYALVQASLADGTANNSVAATLTTQLNDKSTTEDIILAKILPGNMYLGGADTTVSALQTFFLAMALYPEVQRAAHAEIDAYFSDEDKLPYVGAVLKEVLRWHPVAPLGIPHRVTKGDIYEGYFIPAGSIVIGNGWYASLLSLFSEGSISTSTPIFVTILRAIMHDPAIFPEHNRFQPERWLVPGAPVFPDAAFGFGRRECPGRFMARESVWAAIAGVLAAFEISPVEDDPPKELYASGIVSYPKPFKCLVHPRSEAFAALVRATADES
ncbi:cytochrome P450 [Lactarius indigo]|nr:cytochrome P450 [Lactarius indigo]